MFIFQYSFIDIISHMYVHIKMNTFDVVILWTTNSYTHIIKSTTMITHQQWWCKSYIWHVIKNKENLTHVSAFKTKLTKKIQWHMDTCAHWSQLWLIKHKDSGNHTTNIAQHNRNNFIYQHWQDNETYVSIVEIDTQRKPPNIRRK